MNTALAIEKTKKPTNRAKQSLYQTYNSESEIAEALHLIAPFLTQSANKWLSQFRYTDGTGVTQAAVSTVCELTDVPIGTYCSQVTKQINTTFAEPIMIKKDNPKMDKTGRKNPKGSCYKILQPLWKLKQLVAQKLKEIEQEENEFMAQFIEPSNNTENSTANITPNAQTPCGSKDEQPFLEEQNSSFRKNPLEKNIYNISIPISSDNSYIEYGKKETVKDEFQTISNDLFSSTIIPPKIKYYLKEHLEELTAMNFDVVDYERFIMNSPIIDLQADYEDLNYLNEQHLYWVTRQAIQQVEYIKRTTYGLMKDWCERHLETMRKNMMEPQEATIAAPENHSIFNQVMDKALKPQEAAQAPENDFEYKDSRRRKKTRQRQNEEYLALWDKHQGKKLEELTKEELEELDRAFDSPTHGRRPEYDDHDISTMAWHRYDFKF